MNLLKLMTFTWFFALSTQATNHNEITEKWLSLNIEFNLKANEHGFCYLYNGEIYGQTAHLRARLASTSKPVTTLMALKTLGADYEYQTQIITDKKNLHIKGQNDAMFSEEKLFYLIGRLNALGITKLETISFDDNGPIFAIALWNRMSMSEARYSREYNTQQLQEYFNLSNNKKIQSRLKNFLKKTPVRALNELGISEHFSDYKMQVSKVEFSADNPVENNPYTLTVNSPPLLTYLKFQNSVSHNWLADITYKSFGQRSYGDWFLQNFVEENFGNEYYQRRIGFKDNEPHMLLYTGSGLDSKIDGERVDNYSTCAIMMKAYEELNHEVELSKVLPVAGIDIGTLQKRLNAKRNFGAIMAKTGTLMNTKSLAGKLKTQAGDLYFGFFHHVFKSQGADQYNAKIVQDLMTEYLMEEFGGARPLKYKKAPPFFPIQRTNGLIRE